MRSRSEGGARCRPAGFLRWAEGLFVIGGVAMLAWCAVVLTDAYVSQRTARQSLETISRVAAPARPVMPAPTTVEEQRSSVRRGAAIAALSIPRVDLSAVILHGSDARTLRRGPGHLEKTAMPGEAGNVVIAGHRDSFFRPLRNVQFGDDIFVDTPYGRFQYRVTSLRVVHTRDLSVIAPTNEEVLTLITCYPFWLLGNAPDRFVVRATRVAGEAAALSTSSTTPLPEPAADASLQHQRKPPAPQAFPAKSRTPPDDDALVRQAIERFRLAYNARLISRNDRRPGGLLELRTCDVNVDGDQATAHCGTASEWPDAHELHVWTWTLRRAEDGWAIKQIVSAD